MITAVTAVTPTEYWQITGGQNYRITDFGLKVEVPGKVVVRLVASGWKNLNVVRWRVDEEGEPLETRDVISFAPTGEYTFSVEAPWVGMLLYSEDSALPFVLPSGKVVPPGSTAAGEPGALAASSMLPWILGLGALALILVTRKK